MSDFPMDVANIPIVVSVLLDYWSESVLCFDPEKVIAKLVTAIPGFEVDWTDQSQAEVQRVSQRLQSSDASDSTKDTMLRQIRGKARRNGPVFNFRLTTETGDVLTGLASRYSLWIRGEKKICEPDLSRITDALRSLGAGEPRVKNGDSVPMEIMEHPMQKLKSCGVLVFRRTPRLEFLLMKHPNRYDLPKGHIEESETELQCALRELEEETGISANHVRIDPEFRFTTTYQATYKRTGGQQVEKTLVVFLGYLDVETDVITTEHSGFEWVTWSPPHRIQTETIDPLLQQVAEWRWSQWMS